MQPQFKYIGLTTTRYASSSTTTKRLPQCGDLLEMTRIGTHDSLDGLLVPTAAEMSACEVK